MAIYWGTVSTDTTTATTWGGDTASSNDGYRPSQPPAPPPCKAHTHRTGPPDVKRRLRETVPPHEANRWVIDARARAPPTIPLPSKPRPAVGVSRRQRAGLLRERRGERAHLFQPRRWSKRSRLARVGGVAVAVVMPLLAGFKFALGFGVVAFNKMAKQFREVLSQRNATNFRNEAGFDGHGPVDLYGLVIPFVTAPLSHCNRLQLLYRQENLRWLSH